MGGVWGLKDAWPVLSSRINKITSGRDRVREVREKKGAGIMPENVSVH